MATKYYCDGCDKELAATSVENISIAIKKNGEFSAAGGAYELCSGCSKNLVRESNPKNWVRCSPMVKRVAG
jgi:hypothetical protein